MKRRKAPIRFVKIVIHLGFVRLHDTAEPVQGHAHDGQRGHEGRHAREGLDQAAAVVVINISIVHCQPPANLQLSQE